MGLGKGSPPAGRIRGTRVRWLWLALGWVCVAVGGVGVVVPGLPTTVFFIVAASCFARASPRFERWVLELPKVGPLVRDYRAGLGMPQRAKVTAIAVLSAMVALSASFLLSSALWRAAVVVLGIVGVVAVCRVPTRTPTTGGSSAERP